MANMGIKTMSLARSASVSALSNDDDIGLARIQLLDEKTGIPIQDMDVVSNSLYISYTNTTPTTDTDPNTPFPSGTVFNNVSVKNILDKLIYKTSSARINYIRFSSIDFVDDYKENKVFYKERGTSVSSFPITVYLSSGSTKLKSCTMQGYEGNSKIYEEKNEVNLLAGNSTTLDFTIPEFSSDILFKFVLIDSETNVSNLVIEYKFVDPIYVGFCSENILGDGNLNDTKSLDTYFNNRITQNDMTKIIQPKGNVNGIKMSSNTTKLFPFILFPKEWQSPSAILDMNNMNIIDSYSSNSYLSIITDGSSILKDYAVFIGRNGFKTTDSALEKIKYIFD